MSEDVLADAELIMDKMERDGWRLTPFRALAAEVRALRKGLKAVELLIGESRGVVGLHLNGDEAPWDELRTGGRFEGWLIDFDAAMAREVEK